MRADKTISTVRAGQMRNDLESHQCPEPLKATGHAKATQGEEHSEYKSYDSVR
jgi:hypothetical protein